MQFPVGALVVLVVALAGLVVACNAAVRRARAWREAYDAILEEYDAIVEENRLLRRGRLSLREEQRQQQRSVVEQGGRLDGLDSLDRYHLPNKSVVQEFEGFREAGKPREAPE